MDNDIKKLHGIIFDSGKAVILMQKHKYPILEFDETKDAYINPSILSDCAEGKSKCDKLVICFFREAIDELIAKGNVETYAFVKGENSYTFYKFVDSNTLLVHGVIGGPFCGGVLEEAIAFGVSKIMFCGGAGSLVREITKGKLVIITSAIRDEGMSYHYAPPAREITTNPKVVNRIADYLAKIGIEFTTGKTWTTDAFYRETKALVQARRDEGAIVVEMEQAGLIAVAAFRGVDYGAIVYGGDDLSQEIWDGRKWKSEKAIRARLTMICKEIVQNL